MSPPHCELHSCRHVAPNLPPPPASLATEDPTCKRFIPAYPQTPGGLLEHAFGCPASLHHMHLSLPVPLHLTSPTLRCLLHAQRRLYLSGHYPCLHTHSRPVCISVSPERLLMPFFPRHRNPTTSHSHLGFPFRRELCSRTQVSRDARPKRSLRIARVGSPPYCRWCHCPFGAVIRLHTIPPFLGLCPMRTPPTPSLFWPLGVGAR
jgi:hypothetical protein